MMFLVLYLLRHLPCGCVADLTEMKHQHGLLECQWCGAVFERDAFVEFNSDRPVPTMSSPLPLVSDGQDVLELVGKAECGHMLVRKRERGATPEHCEKMLTMLRD